MGRVSGRGRSSMIVYRVAHRTDTTDAGFPIGPYRWERREELHGVLRHHQQSDSHPAPHRDGREISQATSGHIYGFASEDVLRKWFAGALCELDAAGFALWVYEVAPEGVLIGNSGQVAFLPDGAAWKRTESLTKPVQLTLWEVEPDGTA